MTSSAWARIAGPFLLLLASTWTLPNPIDAMSVEDWRKLAQPQRIAYVKGVIDAWNDQVEFAKASKPPVTPPDDLAAMIINCVNSLSMTDAQALGVVEVYMREHPGALQNFPMSITVRVAFVSRVRPGRTQAVRCSDGVRRVQDFPPSNNAFHLPDGLAFARPSAGECWRWTDRT